MEKQPILIVDDEKNIRLTMSQSLEPMGIPVYTAVNGEEALQKLREEPFGLVFLDLKMPGMDGMEVLREIRNHWPTIPVIIITAHGTISSAVDAMKLGAVDFIQKPFSPLEIREVANCWSRKTWTKAEPYPALIAMSNRQISEHLFNDAYETAHRAIAADPARPEAYNLLGALLEIKGDEAASQKFYRAALDIDPSFQPAQANLDRVTSWDKIGGIDFGTAKVDRSYEKGGRKGEGHEA